MVSLEQLESSLTNNSSSPTGVSGRCSPASDSLFAKYVFETDEDQEGCDPGLDVDDVFLDADDASEDYHLMSIDSSCSPTSSDDFKSLESLESNSSVGQRLLFDLEHLGEIFIFILIFEFHNYQWIKAKRTNES